MLESKYSRMTANRAAVSDNYGVDSCPVRETGKGDL